jgi:hypothetical protein
MTQETLDSVLNPGDSTDAQAQTDSSSTPSSSQSHGDSGHGALARRAVYASPGDKAPDHDVEWGPPGTEYGLRTEWANSPFTLEGRHSQLSPSDMRFIVGGDLAEYLATHGDRRVRVPGTFTALRSDWSPYLGTYTHLTADACGYGITAEALEQAIRLLSGSGKYSRTAFKVVGCGEWPWIVLGRTGTLLCTPVPISDDDSDTQFNLPRTQPCVLAGTSGDLHDEATAVKRGIERFATLLDNISWATVTGYCGHTDSRSYRPGDHTVAVEYDDPPDGITSSSDQSESATASTATVRADALATLGTTRPRDPLTDRLPSTVTPTAAPGEVTPFGICAGFRIGNPQHQSTQEHWRVLEEVYLTWEHTAHDADYDAHIRRRRFNFRVAGNLPSSPEFLPPSELSDTR